MSEINNDKSSGVRNKCNNNKKRFTLNFIVIRTREDSWLITIIRRKGK